MPVEWNSGPAGRLPLIRDLGRNAITALLVAGASLSWACGAAASTGATDTVVSDVAALVNAGQFKSAEAAIAAALASNGIATANRTALEFERERMRRILLDFTLAIDEVKTRVRKQIPDLSDDEFARWDAAGLFEKQDFDGRVLYFNRSPSNLFRLSAEARARRSEQTPFSDGPMEAPNAHHREVRDKAIASGRSGVAPRRIQVTQSITVAPGVVPVGKIVRAWIPFPREIAGQQESIRLISGSPGQPQLAPASALQRTAYFQTPSLAGKPTKFSITYEMTVLGQYHPIDPQKVRALTITPELEPFLVERAPHVVYTDDLRAFSARAVGAEKDPYRIAQKLFAAVDAIPWAGAREYSTISNISDYALHAGHADCGQQTLLLITLMRLNGIPARWQSGMVYSEGDYWNLHDWGQFYLEPYGWVPMDVTFGVLPDPDPQIAWFYLGGLDAYRIAFNDDYSREFVPAKQHFRSETVDLQRGEVEWEGGNLYFNQWDYDFAWQVLPGDPDAPSQTPASNGERL